MVFQALQSYLSEKAASFLPGKSFFPEEDKYASQFDPWSSGNRPVAKPWFSISINIHIGGQGPEQGQQGLPPLPPCPEQRLQNLEPTSPTGMRGRQQGAVARVLGHGQGHGYASSTVQGRAMAHFGDVYNYHYFQAQTLQRCATSPSGTLSRSMSFESVSRSSMHATAHDGQVSHKVSRAHVDEKKCTCQSGKS